MPKLTGFFALLPDIYRYAPEDVNKWLKNRVDSYHLQNYIGNRILYPQTIAATEEDVQLELAFVKEFVSRNPEKFYNPLTKKITVPEQVRSTFYPLSKFVVALVEVLKPIGSTIVYIKSESNYQEIGSVFKPEIQIPGENVKVSANSSEYTLPVGQITPLDIYDKKVKLQINLNYQILLTGGEMGVIVDLRN